MAKQSNEQLLKIINGPAGDYLPEALNAAREEMKRRDLSDEEMKRAEENNARRKIDEESRAETPLALHWKILTFIFPGIFQIALSGAFQSEGFERKAAELRKWTYRGYRLYLCLIGLFFLTIIVLAILLDP